MKKQIILFSTPNSGSDWFAQAIYETNPKIKYFREFFNPITNEKYTDKLATGFGCEFVTTYKNIANFDKEICEKIYQETWEKENFNFTKENYCVFKIPFFVEKFDCIALNRKIENSFPPSRRNCVFGWYDSIYNSMLSNFESLPKKTKNRIKFSERNLNSITHKVLMCHQIYQKCLVEYCNFYNIPLIAWESLVGNEHEIKEELKKIPYDLDIDATTQWLLKNKSYNQKNFDFYQFDPITILLK
jgi:hypothetical protein